MRSEYLIHRCSRILGLHLSPATGYDLERRISVIAFSVLAVSWFQGVCHDDQVRPTILTVTCTELGMAF